MSEQIVRCNTDGGIDGHCACNPPCFGTGIGDNDAECVDCGHHYDQHQPHCRLCRCAGIGGDDES